MSDGEWRRIRGVLRWIPATGDGEMSPTTCRDGCGSILDGLGDQFCRHCWQCCCHNAALIRQLTCDDCGDWLGKIAKRTGLDLRRFGDIEELLTAIRGMSAAG